MELEIQRWNGGTGRSMKVELKRWLNLNGLCYGDEIRNRVASRDRLLKMGDQASSEENDFTVVPNFQESSTRDGLYLSFSLDVYLDDKPFLLVDINKRPSNLRYISKREEADIQMRRRLHDFIGDCPISTLYGISAFGTKVCFYKLDTAEGSVIDPPLIPRDLGGATDGIPESQWSEDVLDSGVEDELYGGLREIPKNVESLDPAGARPDGCVIV
ncbi:hypothetical protein FRC00_002272 [Tulasnella sp. 408]|nr:hypothetical protein FRC00_002272 [Tulasnella sp. 408]